MKVEDIFQLRDKKVLITGASRGIGASIAEFLSSSGAKVTLVSRKEEELCRLANRLKAAGGNVDFIALDVKNLAEIRNSKLNGQVFDVLINNAGTNNPMSFLNVLRTSTIRL